MQEVIEVNVFAHRCTQRTVEMRQENLGKVRSFVQLDTYHLMVLVSGAYHVDTAILREMYVLGSAASLEIFITSSKGFLHFASFKMIRQKPRETNTQGKQKKERMRGKTMGTKMEGKEKRVKKE